MVRYCLSYATLILKNSQANEAQGARGRRCQTVVNSEGRPRASCERGAQLTCSFLAHSSNIDDLLEGLDGVLKDWLDRLHNTKSSLHIVNLWLHSLDGLHLSGDLNEWLSVIESLQDSGSEGFLDVLNSSGLSNGGGLVVSGLGVEGSSKGVSEFGDELSLAHGVELVLGGNEGSVSVVSVVLGSSDGNESSGEFHFE